MRVLSGCVLLRITAAEKKKVFQSDLITDSGQVASLIKEIEQEEGMGEAFAQSVQTGEIVAVADDVAFLQVGDIAILDYLVDGMTDEVVYKDDFGKILCIDTRTIYHDDDNMIYESQTTRQNMFVWTKGDVDTASLIYGVFRGDKLIPNPPYIICEHKDFRLSSKTESGIQYQEFEDDAVIRRLLVPNVLSSKDHKVGAYVIVERQCLYERSYLGKSFDVIMDQDIEMSFEQ